LVAESVILEETTYNFNKAGETIHSADKGILGSAPINANDRIGYRLKRAERYHGDKKHQSLNTNIKYSKMALTEMTDGEFTPLSQETLVNYCRRAHSVGLFKRTPYEVRAGALVFFTLKELGKPITIKQTAKKLDISERSLFKQVRIVARFFRNPHVIAQKNVPQEIDLLVSKLCPSDFEFLKNAHIIGKHIEGIYYAKPKPITKTFFATVLNVTRSILHRNFSLVKIAEVTETTTVSTRNNTNELLKDLGFTVKGKPKRELLQMITVDDFINGIRFDKEE
tara:strand:- start:130 stop:972 length:843 start_codon:yes stop_codon:yes gene_type:complete